MAKIKFALGLILFLSLLGSIFPINPVVASPDEVKWSEVNIPTDGSIGNWGLANGSDIQHLTMAIDGSLYCYANPSSTSYTLYKSTNGGYSWSYTGKVEDTIVDIATAPDDATAIYYATASNIYKSTDAGSSFTSLPPNPGGAGSNNIEITSIAVAKTGSNNIIAVGTRDTDGAQFGGVYTLDENVSPLSWLDTSIGNYDIYAVAFSPNFTTDQQLVAVATDEINTIVTNKIGSDWGTTIGTATIPVGNIIAADIAFPDDYDATAEDCTLFVAIDTGSDNGDVYMISSVAAPGSSLATDLNIGSAYGYSNVDVTTLAVTGNTIATNLLAGAANSSQVYFSTDAGTNWTRSSKQPTGDTKTCVLMATDFSSTGKAYAATSGTESAISYTADGGATWNQIGLIDTKISNIFGLAPSPNYAQDDTLFVLTGGSEHSLWRSLNGGARWERVVTSTLANADSIDRVKLSPNYHSSQVIFIAGSSSGNPAIWKSTDNGQSFSSPQIAYDPDTSATIPINTWVVINDNTLFVGSFDGSNGLVYRTTDSGSSYSTPAVAGSQPLNSIALSPNYEEDETILVGNSSGWVYWSNDNGISFEPLPLDATSPPLTDNVTVAFDSQFSHNSIVYAASDTANKGIYHFTIGTSATWESIDSTLPDGAIINQLILSDDGVLYATNSQLIDVANNQGGTERCLDPRYSLGPTFETVTNGLDDGANLTGLWLSGNQLWSIDTTNTRLMTFIDSSAAPVTLTSPSNQASVIGTIIGSTIRDVSLAWIPLGGATSYTWQLDYTADFSTAPIPFTGDTAASSTRLTALEPAITYYWRVRATEPVLSPWSAKWSFTTSLGTTTVAPSLKSPGSGAKNAELKPIFQWSAIAGADEYELLVSTTISFTNPVIKKTGSRALPTTAWQCDIDLNYDTTYYWKVRASGSNSYSDWSAVSAFTTKSAPAPEPTSEPASEPLPPPPTTPNPYNPETGAKGTELKPVFQWSTIPGVDSYELLVSTDISFANPIIAKIGAYALLTTAWQCDIDLNYDTTYYWKTRASGSNSYGDWSAISAFTTKSAPAIAANLYSPEAGAKEVGLKPVFQWGAIAGADSYELLVSTDISFANPIIVKIGDYALPTTAWQCDIDLNYDTTYYWKVRASSSNSYSDWSAVSAFITGSPPSEPPPPPAQQTTPDWVMWLIYLSGALLLTTLALLITMVILTVKVFRL